MGIPHRIWAIAARIMRFMFLPIFIFFLFATPGGIAGENPKNLEWVYFAGRPYLSLAQMNSALGIRSYFDRARGRILLEGQGKNAFFIPWGSYAVIDGRFQRLSNPVAVESGSYYFDGALLQSHLLPFSNPSEREGLKNAIRRAFERVETAVCATDRPIRRVFIDPGHGGDDRGAVRVGVLEKKLTLEFSQEVASELALLGFEAMLSRTTDEFIALDLRPELARGWGADIFVSIHVNTSPFPGARGTETYILSSDATDADARKLAVSENAFLKTSKNQKGSEATLENILWDVGQTAYLQDSAHLAANIQMEISHGANAFFEKNQDTSRWNNRGVREAPFLVLSRSAMPAVLVELAYLSNQQDRKLLQEKDFKTVLAKSIASGIKKFAEHCQGKGANP